MTPHPLRVRAKPLSMVQQNPAWSDTSNSSVLAGPHHSFHLCSLCSCHLGLLDVPQTDQVHCCSSASGLVSSYPLSTHIHIAALWPISGPISNGTFSVRSCSSMFQIAIPSHPTLLIPFSDPFAFVKLITIWHYHNSMCVYACMCVFNIYVCIYLHIHICDLFTYLLSATLH